MRGRTNVLGFSEDFINADVIDAVADENVQAGNFVKFYNAINGGKLMNGYFGIVKELSDGRYMCIGTQQNAQSNYKLYIVILEKDASGNFVQNLPNFETDIDSAVYKIIDRTNTIDIDDDTVANVYISGAVVSDTGYIKLNLLYLHFDVVNNQISHYLRTENIPSGSTGTIVKDLYSLSSQYNWLKYFYPDYPSYVSCYKIGNDLYIVCTGRCSYTLKNETTNGYNSYFIVVKATLSSGYTFSINYGRVLSSALANAGSCTSTVNMIYSSNGSGFFVMRYYQSGSYIYYLDFYNLYFIPFNAFTSAAQIPDEITFTNKISGSSELRPFACYGDELYLIYLDSDSGQSNVYWLKVHFYNYTREGYSYIIYDPIDTGLDVWNWKRKNQTSKSAISFSFLYENENIMRFYFLFDKYTNSYDNISDRNKVYSVLFDVDKENNTVIVNPASEQKLSLTIPSSSDDDNVIYYIGHDLFSVVNGNKFITFKAQYIQEYTIVNDSELSGNVVEIPHVLNGTDINYIQGVAKQSGTSGQTIECYKAKVS